MGQQSTDVRTELTFQSARRSMATARKASIPSSPATIEEVIDGFNKHIYPPLYQNMFVGSVSHEFSGKFLNKYNHLPLLILCGSFKVILFNFHYRYKTKQHPSRDRTCQSSNRRRCPKRFQTLFHGWDISNCPKRRKNSQHSIKSSLQYLRRLPRQRSFTLHGHHDIAKV